jgi:site-specific DNA-cytosine methylase
VGVSIEHVSACDINPDVRAWIQKHYSPAQIHTDMLTRDTSSLPRNVDLYCCGFPCTPFSMRRTNSTKLFEEAAARVFFKTIETLIHVKPKVFVLENVRGILRPACKDAMLSHLEPLAQQYSLVWIMPNESDPKRFGYPIERPRVYIVGIRRDRHCTKTAHQLDQTIHRCLETVALKVRCQCDFLSFLEAKGISFKAKKTHDYHADGIKCGCTPTKSCGRWPPLLTD